MFPTSRSPEDTKVKIVEEAKAVRLMPPASERSTRALPNRSAARKLAFRRR
jgi:hypothetical protein